MAFGVLQAGMRQSRELQAEWQHKYMSIQGESAIMKHELDDVSLTVLSCDSHLLIWQLLSSQQALTECAPGLSPPHALLLYAANFVAGKL